MFLVWNSWGHIIYTMLETEKLQGVHEEGNNCFSLAALNNWDGQDEDWHLKAAGFVIVKGC